MFSYLRPHRRTPSIATSPTPSQLSPQLLELPCHHAADHGHPGLRTDDLNTQRPHTASSVPPSLPPIVIVSSSRLGETLDFINDEVSTDKDMSPQQRLPKTGGASPQKLASKPTQNARPQTVNTLMKEKSDAEIAMQQPITTLDTQSNPATTDRKPMGTKTGILPLPSAPVPAPSPEPVQPRGKARLNLLNPMTLLARRRASNNVPSLLPPPNTSSLAESDLSDGYDPRIRGTKVHDFSEPRSQKRNVPYSVMHSLKSRTSGIVKHQRNSSNVWHSAERESRKGNLYLNYGGRGNHTPVFMEDFNEERYPHTGHHIQKAGNIADLPLPGSPCPGGTEIILRQQPIESDPQSSWAAVESESRDSPPCHGPPVPPKSDIGYMSEAIETPVENKKTSITATEHPKTSLSSKRRSRNVPEVSFRDSSTTSLPRHMKSTSSRFSFDMIGAASQEKLLEDRHRQKALEKKTTCPAPSDQDDMYVEDDYDYDNMDDDDGLEERIPGINADAEDEEFDETDCIDQETAGFTFHPIGMPVSTGPMTAYPAGAIGTPRDSNGEVIGSALTSESPEVPLQALHPILQPANLANTEIKTFELSHNVENSGLGLRGFSLSDISDPGTENASQFIYEPQDSLALEPAVSNDVDDLYFDDGIIEPPDEDEEIVEFDESVFDNDDTDQYGRPIRPLSSIPTLYSPPCLKSDSSPTDKKLDHSQRTSRTSRDLEYQEEPHSAISIRPQSVQTQNCSITKDPKSISQFNPPEPAPSLTYDTLSAYQSALAAAACRAAENGRFRRDNSPTHYFDERDEHRNSRETIGDNQLHLELTLRQPLSPDYEEGFDDVLGDDAIIAEANAEALANDFEGFYGQEFEFYSAPASGQAQYGGCFVPRGAEGVVRSQSGRNAGREPNLTPITELSEYSNRNSTMSLPLNGMGHGGSISSPNLVQLAGLMGDYGEEDMSFSALLKLRRGAWGGSQASLRSSNRNGSPMSVASEDSSPVSQQPPWAQNGATASSLGQTRKNSTLSLPSDVTNHGPASLPGANSAPSSPTITLGTLSLTSPSSASTVPSITSTNAFNPTALPAPPATLVSSLQARSTSTSPSPATNLASAVGLVSYAEGFENGNIKRTQGHRHTTSADSISYMQEEDPISGARWVLERRRTAESGEVEILGREVISGGRI